VVILSEWSDHNHAGKSGTPMSPDPAASPLPQWAKLAQAGNSHRDGLKWRAAC
jgi:hypothetical protein